MGGKPASNSVTSKTDSKEDSVDMIYELEDCLLVGQEAAHVSDVYAKVYSIMSDEGQQDYVPFSWVALAHVKKEHYRALAHYYVALGLLDHCKCPQKDLSSKAVEILQYLHEEEEDKSAHLIEIRIPKSSDEKRFLGKAHLREALLLHEEAMRVNRMCRELRKKDMLQDLLRSTHDRSLNKYASIDQENDFQEVLDPPPIAPSTKFQLALAYPDFSQFKVADLFSGLGPVAIFSAKHSWSVPRTVNLKKTDTEGFGFSVRGDAPVVIAGVDRKSLAEAGGMQEGDFVVGINSDDVKWAPHDQVVTMIKASGNVLALKLVTPMDHNSQSHNQSVTSTKDNNSINHVNSSHKKSSTTRPVNMSSPMGSAGSSSGGSSSGITSCPPASFGSTGSTGASTSSSSHSSPASSITSGSTRHHHPDRPHQDNHHERAGKSKKSSSSSSQPKPPPVGGLRHTSIQQQSPSPNSTYWPFAGSGGPPSGNSRKPTTFKEHNVIKSHELMQQQHQQGKSKYHRDNVILR